MENEKSPAEQGGDGQEKAPYIVIGPFESDMEAMRAAADIEKNNGIDSEKFAIKSLEFDWAQELDKRFDRKNFFYKCYPAMLTIMVLESLIRLFNINFR
nr:MAG TPA_asm: hypothetical protein [Caudoviricetes sp.]